MSSNPGDVTGALIALRDGEDQAFERLVQLVYEDLKRVAHNQLHRGGRSAPLQTTALVNETYLRLADQTQVGFNDRGHFFAAWARAMRHVIVDEVRKRAAAKRGGDAIELPVDEGKIPTDTNPELVLAVDEALAHLGARDPRMQQIVECRFFAGFTETETAEALGMSLRSVQRGWWKARAWLETDLQGSRSE